MGTFATLRTTLGIAKEVTKGTAVAPTAFIPVTKFDAENKIAKLQDQGWRGSMGDNFGMQNGTQYAELNVGGDVFSDTFGYFLNGVLGDLATTGASAPYTHKMALLNSGDGQPKSFTLTDTQGGVQPRAFAAAQCSELSMKWDPAGLFTYEAKLLSKVGAIAANPTASFGALAPQVAWGCVLKFGAVAQTNIQSGELNIKRLSADPVFTLGAADPYAILVGGVEVDGKFTFVATDEAPYLAYAGNTTPGAVTATFSQGALSQVIMQCTQPLYDSAKITRGKSYVEIEASFQAVLNATDIGASAGLSPILGTVVNSLPANTFG